MYASECICEQSKTLENLLRVFVCVCVCDVIFFFFVFFSMHNVEKEKNERDTLPASIIYHHFRLKRKREWMMKKEHRIEVVKYLTRLTSININSKNDKFSLLLFLLLFVDRHISSLNTHTWRLTSGHSLLSSSSLSLSLFFIFSFDKGKREQENELTSIVVLWIPLFSLFLVRCNGNDDDKGTIYTYSRDF